MLPPTPKDHVVNRRHEGLLEDCFDNINVLGIATSIAKRLLMSQVCIENVSYSSSLSTLPSKITYLPLFFSTPCICNFRQEIICRDSLIYKGRGLGKHRPIYCDVLPDLSEEGFCQTGPKRGSNVPSRFSLGAHFDFCSAQVKRVQLCVFVFFSFSCKEKLILAPRVQQADMHNLCLLSLCCAN